MPAAVIPFPSLYRIGYSDGDHCGVVEDLDGIALTYRSECQAVAACAWLRFQFPGLIFWVSGRRKE